MTIICKKCGSENHLESDQCTECGYPIQNNIEYVVCSICGLSNPKTATKCIGCSEPLNDKKSFKVETDKKNDADIEAILSEESSVVYKPKATQVKNKNNFGKWRKHIRLAILVLFTIVLTYFIVSLILGEKEYIEPSEGFYYVSQTQELHMINDDQDNIILLSGIENVDSVMNYGKNTYVLADSILYHHYKKDITEIANNVNSFKINLTGEKVLYTIQVDDPLLGDLYLYENGKKTRIDANVGINRFIFGEKKSDVYYVTEITEEENLGVLYKKSGDDAPKMVADDVFEPVLSLKKDTVYFVRKPIDEVEKFELYYAKNSRVTEIGRNIKHIVLRPGKDEILLIQEKNDIITFFINEEEDVEKFDTDIKKFGIDTFNDIQKAVTYSKDIEVIYQKNDAKNYLIRNQKKTTIDLIMDEYWLSENHDLIYSLNDDELQYSKYSKGKISSTVSVATKASLVEMSSSGESAIVLKDDGTMVLSRKGSEKEVVVDPEHIHFSENEKYMVYLDQKDCYSLKLSAKEPAYLGENIQDFIIIDKYVYTFEADMLYRYKLGKFKSNTEIDTIEYWSEFELSN